MPLFEPKEKNILGVDVGTSSIKIVELVQEKNGTFQLGTYGYIDHLPRVVPHKNPHDVELIIASIIEVCKKAQCRTRRTSAALPTYSVFTSLIALPWMSAEELDSAIRWEAKKIIPLPLEEIVLDYKILNPQKKSAVSLSFGKKDEESVKEKIQEDYRILITGAGKETVQQYTEVFEQSGLTLVSLETEMFALERSLVGEDPGEIMIVEIGAVVTDIIIVEHSVPFLARSLETGGNALTRAIMNSLQINEKRAEQLKRDIGLAGWEENAGIPQILKETLEPIIHEIKYTLDVYKNHQLTPSQKATGTVEKIILTGGTALLPHCAEYLSKTLDMRVVIGDPWAHVTYPVELQGVLKGLGPKFSVAIGLALRGLT